MQETNLILQNQTEFLKFLKSKFTLIHMSNVFFRDLHYGVMLYVASTGKRLKYVPGEKVAQEVAAKLELNGIFKRIDHQTYLLNYPEFALPRVEKKAS